MMMALPSAALALQRAPVQCPPLLALAATLQVAAPPRRDERALQAAALYERITGLDKRLPLDPRAGVVPPAEVEV